MADSASNALTSSSFLSSLLPAARLSQHARLITLETPRAARPVNEAAVVERFTGHEGIDTLFDFQVDVLATSAQFDPFELVGEELTLRLLQADGSTRAWHGQLTHADALGSDGGLARFRLRLQPWLAALALRRDSFVYANQSVQGIVGEVFADHLAAHFSFEVTQDLPVRPTCVQYRESDFDFVRRLLAQEGLSWRFEHDQEAPQNGGGGGDATAPSRHKLVIFDRRASLPTCPLDPIRFHRVDASESKDSITHWRAWRRVQPNSVQRSAWDASVLHAPLGQADSALDLGDVPLLEDHDGAGAQRFADAAMAAEHAAMQLQAHESRTKRFAGAGSVRQLGPGRTFTLVEHDRYGGQRFAVLSVQHEAANNLGAQAAQVLGASDIEKGSYRNRFEVQRAEAAMAPLWRPGPTAPEGMVALVVGADDTAAPTDVHTQRDHRVQVRFHWQAHEGGGAAAGLSSGEGSLIPAGRRASRAPSVWLRVASAVAGPNWGVHHLPRVRSEVLVSFIDGDIDRPVVSQQLFNQRDLPPWSAGSGAAANHPGVLSGWHSRALDGSGFNQWMADDAPGQVRTRLASSNAASQLNLGHLNAQQPESSSRGAWRGSGAELRSDAWVAVRAGEGLLISTTAQNRAGATLHETSAALGQLKAAQEAAEKLSDAAEIAGALPLKANALLQPLQDDIDPQAKGHLPETLNGQSAKVPQPGSREASEDKVGAFARPLMVFDAANSLNLATPASTTLYAGDALHWTSQQQAHLAAGQTVSLAAAASAGLFSYEGGIRAIAQGGPVSVQAHTDQLEWLASDAFTITSSNEAIEVLAKTKVAIRGGETSIALEGESITLTMPGLLDVKGVARDFVGPGGRPAKRAALPDSRARIFHEQFVARNSISGLPVPGMPYRIEFADGDVVTGITDELGKTEAVATADPQGLKLFWMPQVEEDAASDSNRVEAC